MTRLALEPAPGITVPGVGVPLPNEQEATDAAVDYGWLIGLIIVAALLKAAVTYVTKRVDFRLVLVLALAVTGAYLFGKGGS